MMKRQKSTLLVGLMVASLGCSTITAKAGNQNGFVAGMCAVGAAVLGVVGAVALVDWCCSETDDQLITRVEAQCRDVSGRYKEDMMYMERLVKFCDVSESVLHEFATYVWNHNATQQDYRSGVWTAKSNLQSCTQALRKRVNKLEGRSLNYEDQLKLRQMRQSLKTSEELLLHVTWFADLLKSHRDYFNLYDAIDVMRSKYFHELTILESERYSMEMEIKRSILNRNNGQYAFRLFVITITSDIKTLEANIHALKQNYPAKRQYTHRLVNNLLIIKNIIVNDPRYQQELYEWEQAELQRMRIEAEKARARAEQDRAWAEQRKVNAMREQNRILEERNRIEKQKMWNERQCTDNIDVSVNIIL